MCRRVKRGTLSDMAHVILGLLMLRPQSLYELTKYFSAGVSLFYSASTGSIKRALDRLLAEGRIAVESADGPRGRKIYAITDDGREEFRRWMLEEISGSDAETGTLSRVFFLGFLDAADRPQVAANIRERMESDLVRLERLEAQTARTEIPEGLEDVAQYQLATLQYGLTVHRTAMAWAEQHLP